MIFPLKVKTSEDLVIITLHEIILLLTKFIVRSELGTQYESVGYLVFMR